MVAGFTESPDPGENWSIPHPGPAATPLERITTATCDRCGKQAQMKVESQIPDHRMADRAVEDFLRSLSWQVTTEGKHYCPACREPHPLTNL